jgi:hypothetical protein
MMSDQQSGIGCIFFTYLFWDADVEDEQQRQILIEAEASQ